jgi:transposase InsO family protein
MVHANAPLTVIGRLRLIQRLESRMTQAQAAEAQGVSRPTVCKWVKRYREEGIDGLQDRSSRPRRTPHALSKRKVKTICSLRRRDGTGPHRIAAELGMARSTVYGVLRRNGISRLTWMDRTTREVIRYERERPGELLHLDVKKLRRIPNGGGRRKDPEWHVTNTSHRIRGGLRGQDFIHVAIDDHSRYAYVEALGDEKGITTVDFLLRAIKAYERVGVKIERILTDNGSNYTSRVFREQAAELNIGLRRTRPYRPQTNGKAEAFIKTLIREWAYKRIYMSNQERLNELPRFVKNYNHRRPHTSLGMLPPVSRL